ncbi:MAG: NADH-quinone oxidoreductase subunit J [Candidatus Obscuribacterales bacterium]|jgi:NADH:ubiquinone oxidoreductase subunit 6 (subunit J)
MGQDLLSPLLSSPNVETWAFYLLTTLSICLAIGVLADRVVIRSGFILIGVFGTISGIFLLLSAQFLALAQIMIYAVGITLMVVIALMLTNPRLEKEQAVVYYDESLPPLAKLFASCKRNLSLWVSVLSFVTLYSALIGENHWPLSDQAVSQDAVKVLGESLVTNYSIPFEFASVLLLAALMGAVMLAKGEPKTKDDDDSLTVVDEAKKQENNLALQR